jgi:DNA-binding LacI/PurR family transcriptional regulator
MDAKRATLRDVAAAAGVSRALAGFVLGDDHGKSIPETTRERVREAARSLGYAPHGIARALREGSSRVVVLSIDPSLESNYSRTFARGLNDELAAHGHLLLVLHEHSVPVPERQILDTISPRAVIRLPGNYLAPGHERRSTIRSRSRPSLRASGNRAAPSDLHRRYPAAAHRPGIL